MNQDYLKHQMLQLLIIISVCIFGVQTSEVYDEKYSLSTTGPPEYVNSLEDAQNKCVDSWLLEIYDENVATLLKKLNVNIQQYGILLGMKRGTNTWRWSDGTANTKTILFENEPGNVVAENYLDQHHYYARKFEQYSSVICSKVSTKDKCTLWFYNGLCYFIPTTAGLKWFEAHNECIKYGASMAMLSNSEAISNMSFINSNYFWISLSKDTWMWTHAGEDVTFNKWSYDQPIFNDYQRCATTNSDGNEWKVVNCSGTYHIVCMREINPENPGRTQQATNFTTASVSPNILSSGAKAGIGVGVSMALIIIIIIVGVLGFKYFHHFKTKSQSEINSQDIYETPDYNNSQNHFYPALETN